MLDRGARPISCAAFHPERSLVATGGWDGKIKIWDTAEMRRKAVRGGEYWGRGRGNGGGVMERGVGVGGVWERTEGA